MNQCKKVIDPIYSLKPKKVQQIGIEEAGVSNYYSSDITKADVIEAQKFLESINFEFTWLILIL